jgi:hypothetical protein
MATLRATKTQTIHNVLLASITAFAMLSVPAQAAQLSLAVVDEVVSTNETVDQATLAWFQDYQDYCDAELAALETKKQECRSVPRADAIACMREVRLLEFGFLSCRQEYRRQRELPKKKNPAILDVPGIDPHREQ